MKNLDRFHENLNRLCPGEPLTRQEASEAFLNLTGFMSLLIKINERENVVPVNGNRSGAGHDV
jgi:hypothetical protein